MRALVDCVPRGIVCHAGLAQAEPGPQGKFRLVRARGPRFRTERSQARDCLQTPAPPWTPKKAGGWWCWGSLSGKHSWPSRRLLCAAEIRVWSWRDHRCAASGRCSGFSGLRFPPGTGLLWVSVCKEPAAGPACHSADAQSPSQGTSEAKQAGLRSGARGEPQGRLRRVGLWSGAWKSLLSMSRFP